MKLKMNIFKNCVVKWKFKNESLFFPEIFHNLSLGQKECHYIIICYYYDIIFYFDYQSLIILKQREKTNYILLENFPGIESTSVGSLE